MIFVLSHSAARKNAADAVLNAPEGHIVTIKQPTRTLDQNALLWAVLNDLSKQFDWYGE